MKKIVVDMMGSDLGSVATKEGVSLFHAKHPDVEPILVGKEQELKGGKGYGKVRRRQGVQAYRPCVELVLRTGMCQAQRKERPLS